MAITADRTIDSKLRVAGARGRWTNSKRERRIRAFEKRLGRRLRRTRQRLAWQRERQEY